MHESPGDRESALPARFQRVMVLIAEGQNNAEIAGALGLSRHTVENYVSELMQRFDSPDRGKLTLAAVAWTGRASEGDNCEEAEAGPGEP